MVLAARTAHLSVRLEEHSLQLEKELEREVWDSLKAGSWALLSSEWEQYCYGIQRNTFAFSEADDHKMLVLLTLRFYEVMVLIRKTTIMHAARCGLYIEVGRYPCRVQNLMESCRV